MKRCPYCDGTGKAPSGDGRTPCGFCGGPRRNRARCKLCGDVIESTHRHDFVWCSCHAIFVDGGTDYLRRGCDDSRGAPADLIEELSEGMS